MQYIYLVPGRVIGGKRECLIPAVESMPEESGGMFLVYSEKASFYTFPSLKNGDPNGDQHPRWEAFG